MRITLHGHRSVNLPRNMKAPESHYFLARPRAFVLFLSIKPRCRNCVRFDNVVIGKGRGPRFWFRPFSVGLSTPLTSQGCWVQRLVSTLGTNLLVAHPSDGGQRKLSNNTISYICSTSTQSSHSQLNEYDTFTRHLKKIPISKSINKIILN